jgi:hypothetical protein
MARPGAYSGESPGRKAGSSPGTDRRVSQSVAFERGKGGAGGLRRLGRKRAAGLAVGLGWQAFAEPMLLRPDDFPFPPLPMPGPRLAAFAAMGVLWGTFAAVLPDLKAMLGWTRRSWAC